MSADNSTSKGVAGENLARRYLKKKGYRILDVNFRSRAGEIDIVARDREYLVFVEVKRDISGRFSDPLYWIPDWKQSRIIRASQAYLVREGLVETPVRFDVVTIDRDDNLRHIRDAFRP